MQNSTADLFGIMNVLDPAKYPDEDDFLERFGRGMPTPEQVADLQVRACPRGDPSRPWCHVLQPGTPPSAVVEVGLEGVPFPGRAAVTGLLCS